MVNNPPAVLTPITYYGDMRTFLQTGGVLSPSNTQGFNINNKTPDNYNITFGVQQDIGHSILVDVSYVSVWASTFRRRWRSIPFPTAPTSCRNTPAA